MTSVCIRPSGAYLGPTLHIRSVQSSLSLNTSTTASLARSQSGHQGRPGRFRGGGRGGGRGSLGALEGVPRGQRHPRRSHSLVGLDTDTVELTVKTSSSHLITREFDSPSIYLQRPYARVEP
eukprot:2447072-Pyramimonas_sp.AAC.1